MQNVTRVITSKEGDQSALISGVSKHSLKTHYSNYVSADLNTICIELFGIQMADTDIAGVVSKKPDVPVSKTNAVMDGRGYCTCATCEDKTLLDCMMCKHYVTTPANIPYYLEAIEEIDERLPEITINEEKEFLKAKKALNATYLMKLFELVNDDGRDKYA